MNNNSPKETWPIDDVTEAVQGKLLGEKFDDGENVFNNVVIDSRKTGKGDIFVAIKGENHDAHKFIKDVVEKGCRAIVAAQSSISSLETGELIKRKVNVISVPDTLAALGSLGKYRRQKINPRVVAITGSNGKTTTKDMAAGVLRKKYNLHSTKGNFNNEIGLPLTLFELKEEHELAVVELGMNAPGEIRRLGKICSPDIGIITNIGPAHLEGVGSIEGVQRAKAELLETLGKNGIAVLNADDPKVLELEKKATNEVLLYGTGENAAIKGTNITKGSKGVSFTLNLNGSSATVDLNIFGDFMVSNALAAASAGYLVGMTIDEIKTGLEEFDSVNGRMKEVKNTMGIHLIDDTYNANPGSVEAAIRTLCDIKNGGREVVVLGDMFELGSFAVPMHEQVGKVAALSSVKRLYAVGENAGAVIRGAVENGMDKKNALVKDREEVVSDLKAWAVPGDWVLVKGSRGMGMEKIVKGLIEE